MKYVATFLVLFAGVCVYFTVAAKYGQNQGGHSRYHHCQDTSECPECHDGLVRHCFNYRCSCTACRHDSDCHCSQGHTPFCSYGSCHCREHSQSSSQSSQSSHSGHCYHTSECPDCSSHLVRHCLNYRCICTELPLSPTKYCSHSSDCSSCSDHHVGFCSDHKCTCTGSIHCSVGHCDYFGCPGGSYAECAVVNSHHRCMCKQSSSPSSSNHCVHNSDCTKCSEYQVGQCSNNQCTCSANIACGDTGCHGYGCGNGWYPQCGNLDGHSRCLCEPLSSSTSHSCGHNSDCTNCTEYQVGQCHNHQCACSAKISCSDDNGCHGYGCGSGWSPKCGNLDGQSRCLCEPSTSSASHQCEQSSDCTNCSEYQVGQCHNHQCTCSAKISCSHDSGCHGYGCGRGWSPKCGNLDGQSRCLCEPSTSSASHQCEQSSLCTNCSEYLVGQCHNHQCTCSAKISCSDDNGCHGYGCGSGWSPKCGNLDGQSRCLCEPSLSSTNHQCEQSTDCTNCSEYQVGQCHNHQCTCSAKISCSDNNGCHGFGCGSGWSPKCGNLDGQSRCLCEPSSSFTNHQCEQSSDCTNCSEYQVGQCHNHQCTCSAKIACSNNDVCHSYGCGNGFHPKCATLDGQHRCLCEHIPVTVSTTAYPTVSPSSSSSSSSSSKQCEKSSDCTSCSEYQVGQCHNYQCTCSVNNSCSLDSECQLYGCESGLHPKCGTIDGDDRCICGLATTHTHCQDDSDCATLPCSNDTPVPYCNHFQLFLMDFKRCHCKEGITTATTKATKQTTTTSSTSTPASTTVSTIQSTSTDSTTSQTTVPKTTSPPTTTSTSTIMPSTTTATTGIPSTEGKSTTSFTTTEPTTETIKTTTTDPPTTPLVTTPATAVRKCHSCGNANNSVTCDTRTIYLGNLQQCAPGEDFCMTDIVHDGGAIPKTYKRCVTEKECRNKWLHQTSDLEYCINYGSVPMSGQYSCHFCCVSDGCNAGQVPDKSTYYSKA